MTATTEVADHEVNEGTVTQIQVDETLLEASHAILAHGCGGT